ncbi:alkaline phosphatase [Paucibacter oligotrophus]|uniref:Alkaline phosphatase n=1 Tax=Roseateles oligotrophus TaxID=1769250 RepID=A0A840LC42_9BURK|nr:alkaline phosphatase [Roseateles oligotrophus]MBB4842887.1 alkaline phosphatase [Roseateles oligotrophus]
MKFKLLPLAALATMASLCLPSQAADPVVRGPESVSDFYNAGNKFIADGKALIPNARRAKNVILFVGDGMGISTQTAARILEGQLKGMTGEENRLAFETLPYSALSKTYSWDQQTSDSAPTMTAMITGYKAREGMLSVNHLTARGECDANVVQANSLKTMLELAAENGRSTGVVSTARLTHATPAATYAHTPVRDWEHNGQLPAGCGVKDIARQLIEVSPAVRTSLKVAMGGGREYFRHNSQFDPEYPSKKGLRTDKRDLTAEWLSSRGANARFVYDKAGFDAADPSSTDYLLGLFERSHMQYEADRANDTGKEPSLTEMTEKSIKMLQKNPNGFFLHVEAGRIDHAHHGGNAQRALLDTIELSNAVRKAMAMTNEQDTLIIVTADHSHVFTIAGYPHRGNDILGLVKDVPSVDGNGTSPSLAADGMPYTTLGYQNGPGAAASFANGVRVDLSSVNTGALNFMQQAAVPLGSESHAGEDVGIWARGPKAYLVRGSMEQNWIFHVMREAFGF